MYLSVGLLSRFIVSKENALEEFEFWLRYYNDYLIKHKESPPDRVRECIENAIAKLNEENHSDPESQA